MQFMYLLLWFFLRFSFRSFCRRCERRTHAAADGDISRKCMYVGVFYFIYLFIIIIFFFYERPHSGFFKFFFSTRPRPTPKTKPVLTLVVGRLYNNFSLFLSVVRQSSAVALHAFILYTHAPSLFNQKPLKNKNKNCKKKSYSRVASTRAPLSNSAGTLNRHRLRALSGRIILRFYALT